MKHDCHYEETIKDLKKVVFGNGQKGAVERMVRLQTQMYFVLLGMGFIIGLLVKMVFFK